MSLSEYRIDFPVLNRFTYLDHANIAPSPVQVVEAVCGVIREKAENTPDSWQGWLTGTETVRKEVAILVGASPQEIWFANNTSDGLNIGASLVNWRKGDNFVITDLDYPGNVYIFSRMASKEVERRIVRSKLDPNNGVSFELADFEKAVDDRTKVVTLSTVDYLYGYRCQLKEISEIAHSHGALVVVDAIQSVGAVREDVVAQGIDVLACGGQKWTLAPSAGGFFYVKSELIPQSSPPAIGWMSVKDIFGQFERDYFDGFDLAIDARRFATGHMNFPGIIGLGRAAKYINDIGLEKVEAAVLSRTSRLIDKLSSSGFQVFTPCQQGRRAGIVCVKVADPRGAAGALKAKKIVISARPKGLRISPNFYNTDEELDLCVGEMGRLAR